jgi:hypothetical protein
MASFSRRRGTCDYVQIGEEIADESLIVTPKDEFSRKDIIEAMRTLLAIEPLAYAYRDSFDDSRLYSTSALIEEIRENHVLKGFTSQWTFNGQGKDLIAALSLDREDIVKEMSDERRLHGGIYDGMYIGSIEKSPFDKRYRASQKQLHEFLENPDLSLIEKNILPGTNSKVVRRLLFKKCAEQLGINVMFVKEDVDWGAQGATLAYLLEVDSKLDKIFGEYNPYEDTIIHAVGQLVTKQVYESVQNLQLGTNTTGMIRFFVETEQADKPITHVEISGRPAVMSDATPQPIYSFDVDRRERIDLSADDIQEAAIILQSLKSHLPTPPSRDISVSEAVPTRMSLHKSLRKQLG